jgi:hypothetical protein
MRTAWYVWIRLYTFSRAPKLVQSFEEKESISSVGNRFTISRLSCPSLVKIVTKQSWLLECSNTKFKRNIYILGKKVLFFVLLWRLACHVQGRRRVVPENILRGIRRVVPENILRGRRPGPKRQKVPWSWTDWEIVSFVCSINFQLLMRYHTEGDMGKARGKHDTLCVRLHMRGRSFLG